LLDIGDLSAQALRDLRNIRAFPKTPVNSLSRRGLLNLLFIENVADEALEERRREESHDLLTCICARCIWLKSLLFRKPEGSSQSPAGGC
jgi:hypothetical protein